MHIKYLACCEAYRKGSLMILATYALKKKGNSQVFSPQHSVAGRRSAAVVEEIGAEILSPGVCARAPFASQKTVPWGPPTEMSFLTEFHFHLLEEAITTNEVINQLLHHVGAMCIHQLNLLATNPNLPITSVLGKQHPIEAHHLSSICDIMEKAMVNGDTCIIRCILVVFQVGTRLR